MRTFTINKPRFGSEVTCPLQGGESDMETFYQERGAVCIAEVPICFGLQMRLADTDTYLAVNHGLDYNEPAVTIELLDSQGRILHELAFPMNGFAMIPNIALGFKVNTFRTMLYIWDMNAVLSDNAEIGQQTSESAESSADTSTASAKTEPPPPRPDAAIASDGAGVGPGVLVLEASLARQAERINGQGDGGGLTDYSSTLPVLEQPNAVFSEVSGDQAVHENNEGEMRVRGELPTNGWHEPGLAESLPPTTVADGLNDAKTISAPPDEALLAHDGSEHPSTDPPVGGTPPSIHPGHGEGDEAIGMPEIPKAPANAFTLPCEAPPPQRQPVEPAEHLTGPELHDDTPASDVTDSMVLASAEPLTPPEGVESRSDDEGQDASAEENKTPTAVNNERPVQGEQSLADSGEVATAETTVVDTASPVDELAAMTSLAAGTLATAEEKPSPAAEG